MVKFLHTSDWQLGKPYAQMEHDDRRAAARQARLTAIDRLGAVARAEGCAFVVVAGDLFDSVRPEPDLQEAAAQRLGALGLPVYVIPGNHDHGGPEAVWHDDGFRRRCQQRCPNLEVLLQPQPLVRPDCVLLPAPLLRRHLHGDPLAWLHEPDAQAALAAVDPSLPRVVLAHGPVLDFGLADGDDDELGATAPNLLDLARLHRAGIADYVALGDWHGTRKVDDRCWYSGTPEQDRFPKGADYAAGQVLVVELGPRGTLPRVAAHRTGLLRWHELAATLTGEASLAALQAEVERRTQGWRVHEDLLRLHVEGSVGLATRAALDAWCEQMRGFLLRLDLRGTLATWPAPEELQQAFQHGDPAITAVKDELLALHAAGGEAALQAQRAMHWLYRAVQAVDPSGPVPRDSATLR